LTDEKSDGGKTPYSREEWMIMGKECKPSRREPFADR
jgi:hypothetical protein